MEPLCEFKWPGCESLGSLFRVFWKDWSEHQLGILDVSRICRSCVKQLGVYDGARNRLYQSVTVHLRIIRSDISER